LRLGLFLVGAFVGAPTRYLIDQYFRSYIKFPIGILIVNVLGSCLLGIVLNTEATVGFALMGFCGALTTWSAFVIDLFEELNSKNYRMFLVNLMANYGLGAVAGSMGIWIAS
jgi:CrcB protein